jgi:hypothetical protein
MAKWAAAVRSSGGGRRWAGGPLWAAWLRRHPGWCKAFGLGGCSGLRWAKRANGLGAMVGSVMKNKKKVNGWATKDIGPNRFWAVRTDFGPRERIEKGFQILIQKE